MHYAEETASQIAEAKIMVSVGGSVVHPRDLVDVGQFSKHKLSSGKEDYGEANSKEKCWLADS